LDEAQDEVESENDERPNAEAADSIAEQEEDGKEISNAASQLLQLALPEAPTQNPKVVHQVSLANLAFEAKQSRENSGESQNKIKEPKKKTDSSWLSTSQARGRSMDASALSDSGSYHPMFKNIVKHAGNKNVQKKLK